MNPQKKIALDIEGVMADIHTIFVKNYNSINRTNFYVDHITNWDFKNTEFEITSDKFSEYVKNMWYKNWEEIPPIEENLEKKTRLLSDLYTLDIVTNCVAVDGSNKGDLCKINLLKWLEKYNIHYNKFIPLNNRKSKANLDYNYFIDDSPILAGEIETNGKFMFLYDRPWNKHIKENLHIKRIFSLSEIVDFLKWSKNTKSYPYN